MQERLKVEQAIDYLKKFVKGSAIEGQKHLCKSLVPVDEQTKFDQALVVVRYAISQGELKQEDFYHQIGLN